jgi:hypothetical protein
MPIPFACVHCGTALSVSSTQAGTTLQCPTCQQVVEVPAGGGRTGPPPRPGTAGASPTQGATPPPPLPPTAAGTFDAPPVHLPQEPPVHSPVEPPVAWTPGARQEAADLVSVPRHVLYLQGLLLGAVAVGAFWIGLLVGRSGPHGKQEIGAGLQPSVLRGAVSFVNPDEETLPDSDAAAFVLPQADRPESKIALDGLRPADPAPAENHPGLLALRSMGGGYARADEQGHFQVRLPNAGKYYLLVISAQQSGRQVAPPRHLLAELGRFFLLESDLFAGRAYRWQEETVKGEHDVNVVFQ